MEMEGREERKRGQIKAVFLAFFFFFLAPLDLEQQGRLCDASGFIPSRSSLALVSFREIHCPPWAVYMPGRQAGKQAGMQAGEPCTTRPRRTKTETQREREKFLILQSLACSL